MTEQTPPEGAPATPDAKGSEPVKPPRADADTISALQEAPTTSPTPPAHEDRTEEPATGDAKVGEPGVEAPTDTPTDEPVDAAATDGDDKGGGPPPPPVLDDDSPFPLPDITAKPTLDEEEKARRRLLMFIVGGSVAAVILLVVALVLILKPADSNLSSTPTTTKSSATLTLVPAGNIPEGTTVTAKITLISTQTFRSAIVTVDGQKVAQTSSTTEALTFTPPSGKHAAVARVTLQSGEEVMTPPVDFTVGGTSGSTPGSSAASAPSTAPPSTEAPTTASSAPATTATTTPPTTAAGGPIDPAGLSADGAKPLKFGDSVDRASSVFPGEAPDSKCAAIAPTYTGGHQFTYFGFPGGKFSYFLTQDPTMSTVEGAKVGMSADEVKKLVPGLTEKTNAAGVPLLVKKSADGSSELVFFVAADKVLFIAGSTGDLAESKQC